MPARVKVDLSDFEDDTSRVTVDLSDFGPPTPTPAPPAPAPTPTPAPPAPAADEQAFQAWYKPIAQKLGINPNPDDPQHFYDYRAAWKAGAMPDATGHWPSQFKKEGHPNLVIDGVDTRTGMPAARKLDLRSALPSSTDVGRGLPGVDRGVAFQASKPIPSPPKPQPIAPTPTLPSSTAAESKLPFEQPKEPGLATRATQSFMRGVGGAGEAIGGAVQFAGQTMLAQRPGLGGAGFEIIRQPVIEAGASLAKSSEELAKKWTPPDYVSKSIMEDPAQLADPGWWADNFPAILPSMAIFLVPGAAGGFAAGATGAVLGSSIANGLFTAGSVYQESIKAGKSPEEAAQRAAATFAVDAPLTALQAGATARLARSGLGALAKGAVGAGLESGQEMGEQVIQNIATGKPATESVAEAGILGAVAGPAVEPTFEAVLGGRKPTPSIEGPPESGTPIPIRTPPKPMLPPPTIGPETGAPPVAPPTPPSPPIAPPPAAPIVPQIQEAQIREAQAKARKAEAEAKVAEAVAATPQPESPAVPAPTPTAPAPQSPAAPPEAAGTPIAPQKTTQPVSGVAPAAEKPGTALMDIPDLAPGFVIQIGKKSYTVESIPARTPDGKPTRVVVAGSKKPVLGTRIVSGWTAPEDKVKAEPGAIVAPPEAEAKPPVPTPPMPAKSSESAVVAVPKAGTSVPETVTDAPKAKEAWEMTREEWVTLNEEEWKKNPPLVAERHQKSMRESAFNHGPLVAQAIDTGKPVPPEVLADYPDLAPKAKAESKAEAKPEAVATPEPEAGGEKAKPLSEFGTLRKGDVIHRENGTTITVDRVNKQGQPMYRAGGGKALATITDPSTYMVTRVERKPSAGAVGIVPPGARGKGKKKTTPAEPEAASTEEAPPEGYEKRRTIDTAAKSGRLIVSWGMDKYYRKITNRETVDKAKAELEEKTPESSYIDLMGKGEMTALDMAKIIILSDHYKMEGDRLYRSYNASEDKPASIRSDAAEAHTRQFNLIQHAANKATTAGQFIQAISLMGRMSPGAVRVALQKRIDKYNEGREKGKRIRATDDQVQAIMDIAETAGEWENLGAEGNAVADMVRRVYKGEKLRESDLQKIREFAKKIRGASDKKVSLVAFTQKAGEKKAQPQAKPKEPKPSWVDKYEVAATGKAYQDALARIKERGKIISMPSPVDPALWADYVVVGHGLLAKGGINFARWSAKFVAAVGEDVKPYLRKIWGDAQAIKRQSQFVTRLVSELETKAGPVEEGSAADTEIDPKNAKILADAINQLNTLTGKKQLEAAYGVMQALDMFEPVPLSRKFGTFQTMAQLLNIKTWARNLIGNEALYRLDRTTKTLIGTPLDIVTSKFTGRRTTTFGGRGAAREARGGFVSALREGGRMAAQGIAPGGLETQFDLGKGFKGPAFNNRILRGAEKVMSVSLRGFDYAAYERAYTDILGEMGVLEGKRQGLKGDALRDFIKNYAHTADDNARAIAEQYGKYMTFQDDTKLSNAMTAIKRGANKYVGIGPEGQRFGLGDFFLKYPKTPANILMRAVDYSPAGLIRAAAHIKGMFTGSVVDEEGNIIPSEFEKAKHQKAFVDAMGRALVGSGIGAIGYLLFSKGVLRGQREKDKELEETERELQGRGQYTVNVSALARWTRGGLRPSLLDARDGDYWESYDWFQPMAINIASGAAMAKAMRDKSWAGAALGLGGAMESGAYAGMQTLAEQSVVRGTREAVNAVFGGDYQGTISSGLKDIPVNALLSFSPSILNHVRQYVDNNPRIPHSKNPAVKMVMRVANRLPGVSLLLPAAYKNYGVDVPKEIYKTRDTPLTGVRPLDEAVNLFNVFVNPAFISKYKADPILELMTEAYEQTGETRQFPRTPGSRGLLNRAQEITLSTSDQARIDPALTGRKPVKIALTGEDVSLLQRRLAGETTRILREKSIDVISKQPYEAQVDIFARSMAQASNLTKNWFIRELAHKYRNELK